MRYGAFNKAAGSYEANVDIQPIVAQFVAEQAQMHISPSRLTLDVGCGAGRLKQFLPNHQIIGIDAAENMCAIAPHPTICADALHLPFADCSIEAVISSLCLQWVPLQNAVAELARVMQPNAYAVIGLLSDGTMRELKQVYESLNIPPHMLKYSTSPQMMDIFNGCGFEIIAHHQQKNVIYHNSAWQFFKQLQLIGANRTNQTPLTNIQLKQLMLTYEHKFMQEQGLPVTYCWDYLGLTKC
jgi:malonyl-CoA O-methyltransferase